jgi:hypothetical protein
MSKDAGAWGELDHIIIFCDIGAPESGALIEEGFHEGPGNSHPGQGTANRRFFFRNAYLELLWIENRVEAQSPEARPVGLWDRWQKRANGACPFGLVFRPALNSRVAPPPSWTYVPRYFPPGFSIEVAKDIPDNEPLLFYLPFARPALVENVSTLPGGVQIGSVSGATLHLPDTSSLSPALNALVAAGVVSVDPGREILLDVHHEQGSREIIDLRPRLPIRFLRAGAGRSRN